MYLAVEDELSEAVGRRLIAATGSVCSEPTFGRRGNGYLRSNIEKFIGIASRQPLLLLTDLDSTPCPTELIASWLARRSQPRKLALRVAVREVESWVMADGAGFAQELGISPDLVPREPDLLRDPKRNLLALARKAKRHVRNRIVADADAVAMQALDYNAFWSDFVRSRWSIDAAATVSPSLRRALAALKELAKS